MSSENFSVALFRAMEDVLHSDDASAIVGQGVTDHKGIFGTTLGLGLKFPDRVIETPLSEDSVAGVCIGLALNGCYPINTHIRADFGILAANQIINLAAKYKYMFGGLFELPMMFRMVIGRSWGQGAQHSQSTQSMFSHIPGLAVIMPATPSTAYESITWAAANHRGPVIVLEHRLLYDLEISDGARELSHPIFGSRIDREGIDITIVATSIMVIEARRAAEFLSNHGVEVEILDLHSTSHFDTDMILKSVKKTGRLLVADTSWVQYGVSAEISRIVLEHDESLLTQPIQTLGMATATCPTAKSLEDLFYPELSDILFACQELLKDDPSVSFLVPDRTSMADHYKHFKGPF